MAIRTLRAQVHYVRSVTGNGDAAKLKRGSLRYGEAVELADALGYDIIWQKRR